MTATNPQQPAPSAANPRKPDHPVADLFVERLFQIQPAAPTEIIEHRPGNGGLVRRHQVELSPELFPQNRVCGTVAAGGRDDLDGEASAHAPATNCLRTKGRMPPCW